MPWGARWVNHAWVELADDVRRVAVRSRRLAVPWHGNVAVVWVGKRAPLAKMLGDDDVALGEIDLRRAAS